MLITDYEQHKDEQHKTAMLENVNGVRSTLNKAPVLNHSLYVAEFNNGSMFKVLECYPVGETPFLYTTLINPDVTAMKNIETYTGLEFKYLS